MWLITAAGATFAAFPHWYATMFSGMYLPMLLLLVALILRNMGLEYRHKPSPAPAAARTASTTCSGRRRPWPTRVRRTPLRGAHAERGTHYVAPPTRNVGPKGIAFVSTGSRGSGCADSPPAGSPGGPTSVLST